MSEVYINNIKCMTIQCPKCEQKYESPFYNEIRKKLCKCGYEFTYLITKKEYIKVEIK